MCDHEGNHGHHGQSETHCCGGEHEHESECECGGHDGHAGRGRGECCGGHVTRHHCGCQCECSCHHPAAGGERPSWRRFATREERAAALEEYLHELRAEAQAVEERIAALRST